MFINFKIITFTYMYFNEISLKLYITSECDMSIRDNVFRPLKILLFENSFKIIIS